MSDGVGSKLGGRLREYLYRFETPIEAVKSNAQY